MHRVQYNRNFTRFYTYIYLHHTYITRTFFSSLRKSLPWYILIKFCPQIGSRENHLVKNRFRASSFSSMQRATVQIFSLLMETGIRSALFIYKSLIAFIFFSSFARSLHSETLVRALHVHLQLVMRVGELSAKPSVKTYIRILLLVRPGVINGLKRLPLLNVFIISNSQVSLAIHRKILLLLRSRVLVVVLKLHLIFNGFDLSLINVSFITRNQFLTI